VLGGPKGSGNGREKKKDTAKALTEELEAGTLGVHYIDATFNCITMAVYGKRCCKRTGGRA